MMRRRILLWMGLGVLFTTLLLCGNAPAKETYSVRNGDTLTGIALQHGVDLKALKAANRLQGNRIWVHQTLIIPRSNKAAAAQSKSTAPVQNESYTVKKGDTLSRIARKTGVSVAELREINSIRGSALKIGQRLALVTKSEIAESCDASLSEQAENATEPGPEEEMDEEAPDLDEALAEVDKKKSDDTPVLGKWNSPDEQKLLVKVAMGFLGAPYRLGGSSVTGIDCSGFVKKIYEFFNIDLPRTAYEQSRVGKRVSRQELAEGDLLFFNTRKNLGHVGIYIGNNKFVHACSRKKGVRVDNLSTPYYDRRFTRAVRLKGGDSDI